MNNQWMKRTLLAMSIQLAIGGAYAAEEGTDSVETVESAADQVAV